MNTTQHIYKRGLKKYFIFYDSISDHKQLLPLIWFSVVLLHNILLSCAIRDVPRYNSLPYLVKIQLLKNLFIIKTTG